MEHKEAGNELFKAGKFREACEEYGKGLHQVGEADETGLRATLLSNRAQCYLKIGENDLCVKDCEEALKKDPSNVKVLFRKAQGHMALKQVEPAFRDLKRLLDLDRNNQAAEQLMQKLRSLAQDMNSTTTQTMNVINDAETASDEDRTHKLRTVLGSILEDEHLGAAICHAGACEKLWKFRGDSIALKVLSKLADYPTCVQHVLKQVEPGELEKIIREEGESASAALNISWKVVQKEASQESKKFSMEDVVEWVVFALKSDNEHLRRIGVEGAVRLCGEGQKENSMKLMSSGGVDALKSLIAREYDREEPIQQVSLIIGQVMSSLQDDELVKKYAVELCKDDILSADVYDQIRGAGVLTAIFFANKELGEALVKEDDLFNPLCRIARVGVDRAQALACEIFSQLANSESGRAMLAGEPTDLLKLLVTGDAVQVRSAAAVTLAKLNALEFNAESENGMLVLSSVVNLLKPEASKLEHTKGVEAVSFVISDSQVKMMLMKGEGLQVLKELFQLAKDNAKEHYAYGLSFIFENLTMSEDDKRREKLREMEVTEEQWEQFEKLTKTSTRRPGQEDPRENVEFRINAFVENDGIAAMRILILESTSDKVLEAAARTLCNVASVQAVRGRMITQGALRALFKLTSGKTPKAEQFAAHAIAKIFITNNPHVLKDEQLMDAIGPLVRQVRHSDEDLVVFECCMALTNIATVSYEAKQKMINAQGITAFEYAQYSENLMVRRAATEAINNLIPADEVIEWFCKPEKMRLWLLFAQSYEDDVPTACAATGALANITLDERVAKTIAEQEEPALPKLVELVVCGNLDVAHRAIVCLLNLVDSWPEQKGKQMLIEAGAIKALEEIVKKHSASSAAPAAVECLRVLKE